MRTFRFVTIRRLVRHCLILVLAATAVGGSGRATDVQQQQRLLADLYDARAFEGGRLTGMPWRSQPASTPDLRQVQRLLEQAGSASISGRRFHGLFLALSGEIDKAEEIFTRLALDSPADASLHNDLGVIEMARAPANPICWFKAIQEFKLALAARPDFAEPQYNLILVYRRLHAGRRAEAAEAAYRAAARTSAWDAALARRAPLSIDANALARTVDNATPEALPGLVDAVPQQLRKLVLDYAFRPSAPVSQNYLQIAHELAERQGDQTAAMALAPLTTRAFDIVHRVRLAVLEGRDLYLRARLAESQQAYLKAKTLAGRAGSVFDQLWVEVNYADTLIRMGDYSTAAATLSHVARTARAKDLKWLLARALSILGSTPAITPRFLDTLAALDEAVTIYVSIGEDKEAARPLYYQAAYNHIAGSYDWSLEWTLKSLNAADAADHIRLTQLLALVSVTLSRIGYSELAAEFNEEALDHAQKTGNLDLIAAMKIELASLYLSRDRMGEALGQIESAERAIAEISSEGARNFRKVSLNLIAARVQIASGNPVRAEEILRGSGPALPANQAASRSNHARSQSLLLLSKALAAQDKMQEARQQLLKAVEIVESRQDYLSNMDLQVAFDEERRQLYEAAIDLEYKGSGCEAPWKMLQGYKAKLFLELLGKVRAGVNVPGGRSLSRVEVQKNLPADLQIADYAVLEDRLLIWFISRDVFQCRAVPVKRYQLERSVSTFLKQLRERQSVDEVSQELFAILAGPITDLIQPGRVLAVIPDGILHRLPLAALRSSDGRYWIERVPIMASPSVGFLFSGERTPFRAKSYAAFGPRTHDALINKELSDLQQIHPQMRIRAGNDTTKASFLQAIRENDIFYYAGHSAFDVRAPLQSSILLDGDRRGVNTVSALDILEQGSVDNGIVMLSSCETALGNSTDGPGIRGLTSAFLVAGAGAVVGSIWPVESVSAGVVMSHTFDHLIRGNMSIVRSLQAAQIQLLRGNSAHPYYWGGFAVTGNLSALREVRGNS